MKIMVTGLRGIPGVQGGVETHAEHLYPLLVEQGCTVEVIVRSSSVSKYYPRTWNGVHLRRLWSPKTTGMESFLHTFLAVLYAAFCRPDVLHIHAIGPAIMAPMARLLGLRVVVTHHGPDYDREKWGRLSKKVLYAGEKLGMKWANQRIVISQVIKNLVKEKYGLDSCLIPNGVAINKILDTHKVLEKFNLDSAKYVLQVSRIVPEKRQLDLIQAFVKADLPGWKLVLVGRLSPEDRYTQKLIDETQGKGNIIFTDFQSGTPLQELLSHAGIFVLPSSHEGLPIALLEALSYGLCVLASDIPANLEINLSDEQYFNLGNIDQLALKLQQFAAESLNLSDRGKIRNWVEARYNWLEIAEKTLTVYEAAMAE